MARKRARRQAKPTELIVGYVVAGMGLLAAGGFVVPQNIMVPFVALLTCALALVGVWFYYFVYLKEQARREALVQLSIDEVDKMTGVEFENYVEALLRRDGYKTETTATSGDYGVDLVAIKDGQRIAIQCKRYTKNIDQAAVREVYAGMTKYNCSKQKLPCIRIVNIHGTCPAGIPSGCPLISGLEELRAEGCFLLVEDDCLHVLKRAKTRFDQDLHCRLRPSAVEATDSVSEVKSGSLTVAI